MESNETSYQRVPLLLPLSHPPPSSSSVDSLELPKRSLRRRGAASALGALVLLALWSGSILFTWHTAKLNTSHETISELLSPSTLAESPRESPTSTRSSAVPGPPSSTPALVRPPGLVDFDLDGPFNGSALAHLCNRTEWVPNRWVSCDRLEGGIGNVRNEVLTCLRYTIAAGAGWSLPSLRIRGEVAFGEESLHSGGRAPLDFFFDVDHLKSTLSSYCPQLRLADSLYEIPNFGLASMPDPVKPKMVYTLSTGLVNGPDDPWPAFINNFAGFFREDFDKVYTKSELGERVTVHRLDFAYFEWDLTLDPPSFWHQFGRVLKFAPEVIQLASEVHSALMEKGEGYFGMHERLEKDVGEQWGSFNEQSAAYVDRLLARPHLSNVYLACGDESVLPRLEHYIHSTRNASHIAVHSKKTVLGPEAQVRLQALHFDQRAQVDYLVLLLADFHAGSGTSSFSANLGVRRHLGIEGEEGEKVFMEAEDEKTFLFRGDSANFMRRAMWP